MRNILLIGFLLLLSCADTQTTAEPAESAPKAAAPAASGAAGLVFVDQESCCACTRTRQEATWKNLQEALDGRDPKPKVEVVHLDTQEEEAQLYLDLKPIMVSPGLYFFNSKGDLVEMLQGELKKEQITAALDKLTPAPK